MSLREHWDDESDRWVEWSRTPGHDTYWRFHRDRFLALIPPPTGATLDIGCGEGRFPRELAARGYQVIGIDASPRMVAHARRADPDGDYRVADAAALPFPDAGFTLVVALLSLHDIDEMPAAVAEASRVLVLGGHLCVAIVHPMNSAGAFESSDPTASFVIRDSYLEERLVGASVERDGLKMTFRAAHRPLQAYTDALAAAGLRIDRLAEIPDSSAPPGHRWQRLPLFLHLRAVKP